MTVRLDLSSVSERWETVRISKDESFEVCVRSPTYAQQSVDHDLIVFRTIDSEGKRSGKSRTEHRIETSIVDWRGVETEKDGKTEAVPFSHENLSAICSQHPVVFDQIVLLSNSAYHGGSEESAKNSD